MWLSIFRLSPLIGIYVFLLRPLVKFDFSDVLRLVEQIARDKNGLMPDEFV